MTLEIRIDLGLCMGAGECVDGAPATFAIDDKRRAYVVNPSGNDEEVILEAAARCPNFAITVRRDAC